MLPGGRAGGSPVAVAVHDCGKGHEFKTAQAPLGSLAINLVKAAVTAESLHCQDPTADLITREKGGD